ncbi:MAG: dTDP-4-dehydrorhamnose reductase [Candidatus Moraniibacteriota bacterium]|nr:MAG: dTDP-4-dehydrorhamnose reductase [Candidatus Moranbacteria bacterium]
MAAMIEPVSPSSEKKKVLILGAKGILGQALVQEFRFSGYPLTAWDIDEIDLTAEAASLAKIAEFSPNIIINAAAYNAVDACEEHDEEYRKALTLNRDVPGYLARYAAEHGVVFVHYSTDYVFDGTVEAGYSEDAIPNPISRYGTSKYEGEKAVLAAGGIAYLIRLSKLFGEPAHSATAKRSFFEVMLAKGKTEPRVEVVDDETSCFTYAPDLALATRELIEDAPGPGIYHLPNEGGVTWFQAALELFRRAGLEVEVSPVTSAGYVRPARRPHASVLINTKRPKQRLYTEALSEFLETILSPL